MAEMETHRFYSHGKLLLSGEYMVLDGALALTVPLKMGQHMEVTPSNDLTIQWRAYDEHDFLWFEANLSAINFGVLSSNDLFRAEKLSMILNQARRLNPGFMMAGGAKVDNHLEFSRLWGFGSSSTYISNVAAWADIDPFALFFRTSGGSGYDIASARANGPIFYQHIESIYRIEPIPFLPAFRNQIYFVYTGLKKDSDAGIEFYRRLAKPRPSEIASLSAVAVEMTQSATLSDFEVCMMKHERIISRFLHVNPIKEERFSDFKGEIKSLGAWGGDFLLVTWTGSMDDLRIYFAAKTINLIFGYDELVI
jgi:mevalonate kinase